jgi:hypothetical protein
MTREEKSSGSRSAVRAPHRGFDAPQRLRISARRFVLGLIAGAAAALALGVFASSGPQPEHSGPAGSGLRPSVEDPSSDSSSLLLDILASGAIALAICAVVFAATALIPRLTDLRRIRGPAARTLPDEPEELSDEDLVKSLTTVLATAELTPSERIQLVEARVRLARATPVQGDERRLPYWVAFGSPVVGMMTGVAGVLIALAQ